MFEVTLFASEQGSEQYIVKRYAPGIWKFAPLPYYDIRFGDVVLHNAEYGEQSHDKVVLYFKVGHGTLTKLLASGTGWEECASPPNF